MESQKLFTAAHGRRFRVQAISRATGEKVVLAGHLTEAACRAYEPSRSEQKLYKWFRVAFACSKL